ncbi:MAG: L-lactate dehydrogenase complex protein LldG [Solirubrobacteraceae bacterium]|nr:L-lactate dehydrogenase complex protein LldG [Solirubrobacteraceae bacterium]
MSSARDDVLARVRAALRDVPRDEAPQAPAYEPPPAPSGDPVARFAERVADYRATVVEARDVAAAVAEACAAQGAARLAVAPGVPAAWRPAGVELVADDGLSAGALDELDGTLTGCALAIAETGTFVLDAGERSGRRALTLIPDLHVCVVERRQVVATVPEAIRALEGGVGPFTFVSGPSATSDIELDRVEGVHGPRRLVVVLA